MANNKVIFGNTTVMDITDSTVTPETLKQGEVAYNSAGQRIVGTLVTIGHKILDAFGNLMTNRENLQFQGTYVSDDSTNNKTVVPIVRSMQQAEFEQLTAAEKTGIIDVQDAGFVPTDDERLLDLKDCSIVLPVNGQVLKYNSTTGKWVNADEVSVPEIVDNLTTDDATKTLSAKQGKTLKDIIDNLPTGIKGNSESAYRTGNVNLTAGNVGAIDLSSRGETVLKVDKGVSHTTSMGGYWGAMCNSGSTGAPTLPTAGRWWHILSMDWMGSDVNNWISQVAIATQDGSGIWWRRNNSAGTSIENSTWHRLAEGDANGNALATTSSKRFKHNIEDMSEERARKILEVRPVTFDWNGKEFVTTRLNDNVGVIAEELSQIIPELVVYEENEEGKLVERRVEYDKFTPYLIKMVQMQQKEIDELKKLVGGN